MTFEGPVLAALITAVAGVIVSLIGFGRTPRLLTSIEKVTAALERTDPASAAHPALALVRDELSRRLLDSTMRGWLDAGAAYLYAIGLFVAAFLSIGGGIQLRLSGYVGTTFFILFGLGALLAGLVFLILALWRSRRRYDPGRRAMDQEYRRIRAELTREAN